MVAMTCISCYHLSIHEHW